MELMEFIQVYWYLFAAAVVLSILIIANEVTGLKSKKFMISVMDALKVSNDDKAVIVDLRSKKEFLEEHVPQAINVEFADIEKKFGDINQYDGKKIILYCVTGPRSNQACIQLKKLHENADVYAMIGGINGWKEANLPTVKGRS